MAKTNRSIVALCVMGALGVSLGAFGAHALKESLEPRYLEIWQTAVFYLMVHTLLGVVAESRWPGKGIGVLVIVGNILFSGSLFTLALTQIGILGAITPLGGVSYILAWLFAAKAEFGVSKSRQNGESANGEGERK